MDVGDLEHRMFLFFDMYLRKVEEIKNMLLWGESTAPWESSHEEYGRRSTEYRVKKWGSYQDLRRSDISGCGPGGLSTRVVPPWHWLSGQSYDSRSVGLETGGGGNDRRRSRSTQKWKKLRTKAWHRTCRRIKEFSGGEGPFGPWFKFKKLSWGRSERIAKKLRSAEVRCNFPLIEVPNANLQEELKKAKQTIKKLRKERKKKKNNNS